MKHIFGRFAGNLQRFAGRRELVILLAGLLVVAGAWGFIELADEVMEGETRQFDEWAVRVLRQPDNPALARGPLWLLQAARDISALGGYTVLTCIVVIVVGFLAIQRNYRTMWLILLSTTSGVVLSNVLKIFYARERPDIPHLTYAVSASLPSGHAMLSAIVYLTLGTLLSGMEPKRTMRIYLLATAMLLTFMVGLSRVYLGVHYPTDVLAGWTAGLVWALFCWMVSRYI